jgi:predicted DNA-binding transcriptional regulator AlpA
MHVSSVQSKKPAAPSSPLPSPPIVQLAVGERFGAKRELLERVGSGYAYICDQMEKNEFPRPVDYANGPRWLDSEITAWMHSRPRRLVRGDPGAAEAYAKQHALAEASAEARRRGLAKTRRDNVRVRARKSASAA